MPYSRGGGGQLSEQSQLMIGRMAEIKRAEVLAALEWDCRMGINTLIARLTGVSRQAVNERLKLLSSDKRQSLGFKHEGFVSSD